MEDIEKDFPHYQNLLENDGKPGISQPEREVNLKTLAATLVLSFFAFQGFFLMVPSFGKLESSGFDIYGIWIVSFYGPVPAALYGGYFLGFKPTMVFGFLGMAVWSMLAGFGESLDLTLLRKLALVTSGMWLFVTIGRIYMILYFFKSLKEFKLIMTCVLGGAVSIFTNAFICEVVPYNLRLSVYFPYCLVMAALVYFKVPNTPRLSANIGFNSRGKTLWPNLAGFGFSLLLNFVMMHFHGLPPFPLGVCILVHMALQGLCAFSLMRLGHVKFWDILVADQVRGYTEELREIYLPVVAPF